MKIWHPRHPTPAMQSASGLAGMGWRGRWTIRTGRPTPGSLACKKVVCTCKNRASASTLPHGSLIVRARRNKSESDVTHWVFLLVRNRGSASTLPPGSSIVRARGNTSEKDVEHCFICGQKTRMLQALCFKDSRSSGPEEPDWERTTVPASPGTELGIFNCLA